MTYDLGLFGVSGDITLIDVRLSSQGTKEV